MSPPEIEVPSLYGNVDLYKHGQIIGAVVIETPEERLVFYREEAEKLLVALDLLLSEGEPESEDLQPRVCDMCGGRCTYMCEPRNAD